MARAVSAQNGHSGTARTIMPANRDRRQNGYARACRLADSHGPLTVSPFDGQDGGAVSAVVIDRSRTVLVERCRLIDR
jgi:hypothetical protein